MMVCFWDTGLSMLFRGEYFGLCTWNLLVIQWKYKVAEANTNTWAKHWWVIFVIELKLD